VEIKDLYMLIKKEIRAIVLATLLLGFAGVVLFYILPPRYIAAGSFYVTRKVSNDFPTGFFEYEGFYAQQAASSYTETVIGLFESIDIRRKALLETGAEATDQNLRAAKKVIRAKKAGPQLITLNVKGKTPQHAGQLWIALSKVTLSTVEALNQTGDTALTVSMVDDSPIIQMTFTSIYVNFVVGALVGLTSSIFILALKKHLS
jgi:capsular polysaccharide biosynthesis protein